MKNINEILKNADPKTVEALKAMLATGELDSVRSSLHNFDKSAILSALANSGGDLEKLKNNPDFAHLAQDPAILSVINKLKKR